MNKREEMSNRELLVAIDTKVDILCARDADKEKRLRRLERQSWITYALLAVAVFFRENVIKIFRP